MAFNVNDMRASLQYGGARPSLFNVLITNPVNPIADLKAPFLVRAAQQPAWSVSAIKVPYFGREINVHGTRKFEDWNVTVINDEDYLIRNAMEQWSNAMNSLAGNINTTGSSSPLNYKSQATVTQYSKTGEALRTYQFNGIFPTQISPIENDWSNGDALSEFQVTFAYDYFQVISTRTGNAGGT